MQDCLNILQLPNLKPKSFTCPFEARTTLLAGAGAAGEQTAAELIMEAASRVKLTCSSKSPSKQPVPVPRRSGTDKGAAKQQ